MESNPCLSCSGKDQNKNNPNCINCDKRIEYINDLAMKLNYSLSYGESGPTAALAPMSFISRRPSLE